MKKKHAQHGKEKSKGPKKQKIPDRVGSTIVGQQLQGNASEEVP